MSDPYRQATEALKKAVTSVAVTGAGTSAESGIPTFREAGGIWEKYPPEEYATLNAYQRNPEKVWKFWCDLESNLGACAPNPGHFAIAEMERRGILEGVITQNIDNLHQAAGSRNVIEYHGNARWLVCLRCRHREPLDLNQHGDTPPYCSCGSLMKPDVIMFGEMIPSDALVKAASLAESCQALLVVGTSARVIPAAHLPILAHRNGAFIIEANIEETDFTSTITDAFLKGPAGETLPKLVEYLDQVTDNAS